MRLKSSIWIAAYLRRCQHEGAYGLVRRRGAEEAGAIFIKINRLDGTADLYGPAPQSAFEEAHPGERMFAACLAPNPPRRPTSRPIWSVSFATIPTYGSLKWMTAAGGIFSTS
jgi:hypothetical protein